MNNNPTLNINPKISLKNHFANLNKENSQLNDNWRMRDEQQQSSQSFDNYEKFKDQHQYYKKPNNNSTSVNESQVERDIGNRLVKQGQHQQKQAFSYNFQNESQNNTQSMVMMHQASMSNSFSLKDQMIEGISQNTPDKQKKQRADLLDSNGNVIRGRKIDSPQLVVVRELRDQEDLEEGGTLVDQDLLMKAAFHSGSSNDEPWKTKDRTNSEKRRRAGLSNSRQRQLKIKSQENKRKSKSQQKTFKPTKEDRLLSANLIDLQNINQKIKQKNLNLNNKGTKSSREIRSSMGFNELLNQLDKDVSLQQSNPHDFKNRTTHDLLKLELSGIRRQNSSGANLMLLQNNNKSQEKQRLAKKAQNKQVKDSKSKSQERKQAKGKTTTNGAALPKSILKKNSEFVVKDQIFQYAMNQVPLADLTPDRNQHHQGVNTNSFLHSEHGRATTSQAHHNQQQNLSYQHQSSKPSNSINVLFSKIKLSNKSNLQSSMKQQKDQSSPDRYHASAITNAVREFKGINVSNNIDKLVRQNIRRMKSKEEEEKQQKQINDDQLKRKRVMQELKNNMVRKINKDKTYKKQQQTINGGGTSNIPNFQQSQDLLISSDALNNKTAKLMLDEKFSQISNNIMSRDRFIQKSSQSQKIDFEKIKETSKGKRLNLKNHRKSYGLEFIDIKKEIQEELRTIDLKFKNNLTDKILEEADFTQELDHHFAKPQKRLKIKHNKKHQDIFPQHDQLNPSSQNQFISDRQQPLFLQQPINKVVVVKKNKIRKFMKMKKKHLIIQKIKEQKEEIMKGIKMQENIMKLNEFCKKKLEKQQIIKKRNATIQHNDDVVGGHLHQLQAQNEISKISGRKIVFDNTDFKRTINNHIEPDPIEFNSKEESSRLSTEFYEEYFRLINSIKKEQQQQKQDNQQSRMDISSQNITTKSYKNLLKSPGNNKSQSPITQISNTQITALSPKSHHHKGEKSLSKKTKSKSNLKSHHNNENLNHQKSQSKNTFHRAGVVGGAQSKTTLKSGENQQQRPTNSRAESAPLLLNQQNSIKKRSGTKFSPIREKKKTSKKNKNKNQGVLSADIQMFDESQRIHYFLQQIVKIQSAYRLHLLKKGFYDEQEQHDEDGMERQNPMIISDSLEDAQHFRSSDGEFQTQVYDGDKLDSLNKHLNNQDLDNDQSRQINHLDYGNEDDEDDEYDDDEEHENGDEANLIIINQQNDDKKVVYMSNINSCSLPQTPKIEDQQQYIKQQKFNQGGGNPLQKVFEYKPGVQNVDQNEFFISNLSINDQVHQSISQKPSLESHNTDRDQIVNNFRQDLLSLNQKSEFEAAEEESKVNYNMRLFAGSESLLREFKHNTPKQQPGSLKKDTVYQQHHLNLPLSNQTSVRGGGPSSHTTSQQQVILPDQPLQQNSSSSHTSQQQNSHSSQSLFERNSFQAFTQQKLQQMLLNNEYLNLIEMREKALEYRQVKEKKFIKKMYKNNQYSPRTYNNQKEQLERWVSIEKEEISKTKKQFQEEWQKTLKMIEETQRNVDQMREKMKISIDNNNNQQQQHRGGSQNHLQFNSESSRNSSSSFATINKQQQQQDKKRSSILEQEEYQPMSQRSSMRLSISLNDKKDMNSNKKNNEQKKPENNEKEVGNLIDFLEQSWIKNQKHQTKGKDEEHKIEESDSTKKIREQMKAYAKDDLADISQDELIQQFNKQQQDSSSLGPEERPLTRSRSEQDLSDLLKKSKISLNDFPHAQNDHLLLQDQEQQNYRLIDSYRADPKPVATNNEIKIQENLFDDSSNRYSRGKNYYHDSDDNDDDSHEQGKEQHKDDGLHDLQSNDSLLNESELNNYFQDQKFSIEDFKSLDKRKILNQHVEEDDDEVMDRNESQIFIEQVEDTSNIEQQSKQNNKTLINNEEKIDSEPSFIDQRRLRDQQYMKSMDDPLVEPFLNQNILFQNTKPGENIRISDILRKSQQQQQDHNLSSSFLYPAQSDTSQILFQNQQINQSMVVPSLQPLLPPAQEHQNDILANQIVEELLAQLLQSEIIIPKRQIDQQQQPTNQQHLQPTQDNNQVLQSSGVADVFIIDQQHNEKEQRREMIEFRQRIIIEQDLIRVENYINEVIASLQQAELSYLTQLALMNNNNSGMVSVTDQQPNYHRLFLQVLTTPVKRNELEVLNQLQTSEIGSYEHFETALDPNANPILPIDLYLDIERQREESQIRMLYNNGLEGDQLESSVLQESIHIHNKSLFDALNESLMKFRPYGIQGEPMPWSNKNRRLQTKVDTNSVDTERLFFMVKQDVLRWAQTFSGCQPSPIFLIRREEGNQTQDQFDDELFQETRERRLAQMLATEVVENEHQWLNYEFEEAQVKIDLSDMILEHLVEEVAVFLNDKSNSQTQ